jgi:hypothetical protein
MFSSRVLIGLTRELPEPEFLPPLSFAEELHSADTAFRLPEPEFLLPLSLAVTPLSSFQNRSSFRF